MAVYRFKVSFEDYEDVYREIDMPSKSTFIELHETIHKTTQYDIDRSSSFYVSNDQWKKGTEIAFEPSERKKNAQVLLMTDVRLSKFIDDPHQKFYYVYNFDRPYDFHVELIKILKEEDGKVYPNIHKTIGQAPKNLAAANFPVADALDDEDDEEYTPENAEEYGVDEEDDFDNFDGEDEQSDGSDEQKSPGGFSGGYE